MVHPSPDRRGANLWCVVPAAGRGARLAEDCAGKPKAMVRVGGRTLVERLLDGLASELAGACLVVREGMEPLVQEIHCGIPLRYAVQSAPVGVADAVLRAEHVVPEAFVVVMGDTYYSEPLAPYIAAWRRSGRHGAVLVEPIRERPAAPAGFATVRNGEVTSIWKDSWQTPDADAWRVAGMMILPAAAFGACRAIAPAPATGELEIEDAADALLAEGYRLLAMPYRGWRRNVNTRKDLRRVEAHLAARRGSSVQEETDAVRAGIRGDRNER